MTMPVRTAGGLFVQQICDREFEPWLRSVWGGYVVGCPSQALEKLRGHHAHWNPLST